MRLRLLQPKASKLLTSAAFLVLMATACRRAPPTKPLLNDADFESCQSFFLYGDCETMEPAVFRAYSRIEKHCSSYYLMVDSPDEYTDEELARAEIRRGEKLDPLKAATCSKVANEFLRCMFTGVTEVGRGQLRGKDYEPNPGGTCGLQYRHQFLTDLGFTLPTNEEVVRLRGLGKEPTATAPWG